MSNAAATPTSADGAAVRLTGAGCDAGALAVLTLVGCPARPVRHAWAGER